MEFTDDLIEAYDDLPKLVNHLHLPVRPGLMPVESNEKRHTVEAIRKNCLERD